jgi:hypothetical protein
MRSSLQPSRSHSLSSWSCLFLYRVIVPFASFYCSPTLALISDACRQEVDLILNSTELVTLFPKQACDFVDIRPNFCTVFYEEYLSPFEEYCENTLGMQLYYVETLRVCQDADYYNIDDVYCVGKSCSNETEIREVLTAITFPTLDQATANVKNRTCNGTTFGDENAEEQCTARTEEMYNYPCLGDLFDKNGDFVRRSQCNTSAGKDCLYDMAYSYCERTMLKKVCELTGNQYREFDHIWDCVLLSSGATFQYSFKNDPYCQGQSCAWILPDYSDAFKELGCECKLATFTVAFAANTSSAPRTIVVAALAWVLIPLMLVAILF